MELFNNVGKQNVMNLGQEFKSDVKNVKNIELQSQLNDDAQQKKDISKQLDQTVKDLNEQMEALKTNVAFGYNDKIQSMYVDVKERNTGKLIRKIPNEEAIKLAEHFREIIGVIFDKRG